MSTQSFSRNGLCTITGIVILGNCCPVSESRGRSSLLDVTLYLGSSKKLVLYGCLQFFNNTDHRFPLGNKGYAYFIETTVRLFVFDGALSL